MTLRNLILIVIILLFLVGYAGYWAYTEQYRNPQNEITTEMATLTGQIETWEGNAATMRNYRDQHVWLFHRTLPLAPADAGQYAFWLHELLQLSGFENNDVRNFPSASAPMGADYRFHVQSVGTLEQLSYFLIQFYNEPFLHRITSMTLSPVEGNEEQLTFTMIINALALRLNPFPPTNQLPTIRRLGWNMQRLQSNDPAFYQIISDRNLLRTARGGIDDADFTFLTGLPGVGRQREAWFTVRTTDSVIRARLGDTIRSGSFVGRIVEMYDQDIVLDRGGTRWLLTTGERLSDAFALPPETGEMVE